VVGEVVDVAVEQERNRSASLARRSWTLQSSGIRLSLSSLMVVARVCDLGGVGKRTEG